MRILHVLAICTLTTISNAANAQEIDWKKVDEAIGRPPPSLAMSIVTAFRAPTFKYARRRHDQTRARARRLGGVQAVHAETMVMGDLVLLETEINPVMTKLIENGLEITAVHNHVLRAAPRRSTCMSAATVIR